MKSEMKRLEDITFSDKYGCY